MTQEEQKYMDKILSNPAYLREKYIRNNFSEFVNRIEQFIKINNIDTEVFKEKLWYYINNYKETYICKHCGVNKTTFNKNFRNGFKNYCCVKCTQQNPVTKEDRKQTSLRKYGVVNVAQSQQTKDKQAKTNMRKYGTKSSFQNKEVQATWRRNIQKKYKVDHVFQLESVKEKSKITCNEKYGTDYFVQCSLYKEVLRNHNLKTYKVEWYPQSDDYKIKSKESNLRNHDCEFYLQSKENRKKLIDNAEEYEERRKQTCIEKYETSYYTQSNKFKEDHNLKYTEIYKQKLEGKDVKLVEFKNKRTSIFKSLKCGHEFECQIQTLLVRFTYGANPCFICNPLNSGQSGPELKIGEWLSNFGLNIELKNRSIIPSNNNSGKNLELDIYLPDYKVAIEHNGLHWHSNEFIPNDYHLYKTHECEKRGIHLIHIWGDDWLYKQNIIKSIIMNKLNLISENINANDCNIKNVSNEDKTEFLNDNHIQGMCNSSINLGLYYEDELISLMVFDKIGNNEYELIRFCNIVDVNVIGTEYKLFTYFKDNYQYDKVVTYSDIAMFDGEMYKVLGFQYNGILLPEYSCIVNGVRINELVTNEHYKIYDCGKKKWIYS